MQRIGPRHCRRPRPAPSCRPRAEGEAALLAAVRDGARPAKRIVDLFSGVGTFTLPLAETAEVHAVEGDAAMIAALDRAGAQTPRTCTASPPRPATCSAARWNLTSCKRFDAVVIDPPRAGAEAQTAALAASRGPGDRRRVLQSRSPSPATPGS